MLLSVVARVRRLNLAVVGTPNKLHRSPGASAARMTWSAEEAGVQGIGPTRTRPPGGMSVTVGCPVAIVPHRSDQTSASPPAARYASTRTPDAVEVPLLQTQAYR